MLLASLALVLHGSLFGYRPGMASADGVKVETVSADGSLVVNTTDLCRDVAGYGGPVPVEIYLSDGRIDSIVLREVGASWALPRMGRSDA